MDNSNKLYVVDTSVTFDATFHALAVLMEAVFITADEKHYNKTKDLIGSVVLLENFYSSG